MPGKLACVSPIDGHVFVERPLADAGAIDHALSRATMAQRGWGATPLAQRQAILSAAVDAFVAKGVEIAEELTRMMGRPVSRCSIISKAEISYHDFVPRATTAPLHFMAEIGQEPEGCR